MSELTSRLIHGDCLEVMPTLAPSSVAMVFADLPYGSDKIVTANKWDKTFDLPSFWKRSKIPLQHNCVLVLTAKQPFAADLIYSNRSKFRYDCVYIKSRATRHHHAKRMPLCAHEHLLIFGTGKLTYNPIKILRDKPIAKHSGTPSSNYAEPNLAQYNGKVYTDRHPTTALQVRSENAKLHPTQKPVALLEWLIKTYTNPGDTVLDPVAGSGTTSIAALRTGRHSISIEQDPMYFAVMQKRVADERTRLGLPAE